MFVRNQKNVRRLKKFEDFYDIYDCVFWRWTSEPMTL